MNINMLFNCVPQRDAFISIQIEDNLIDQIVPEYENIPEHCICIYGVSEEIVDSCLWDVVNKAEEYKTKITKSISKDILCDLLCKPIFLFENKEMATVFMDYANTLNEEQFAIFIDELQCDYNVPWQHVQTIKNEKVYDIIDHYERRFGDDFS